MPTRTYKPTSPGRRDSSGFTFEEITKKKPEKSLLAPLKKKATGGDKDAKAVYDLGVPDVYHPVVRTHPVRSRKAMPGSSLDRSVSGRGGGFVIRPTRGKRGGQDLNSKNPAGRAGGERSSALAA